MYSAIELKKLQVKPRINDISLLVLSEYYEIFLNLFIYKYKIRYKDDSMQNLELRFDIENFCHLLGLESIAKNSVSKSQLYNYRGLRGWKNIKSGFIDIRHLKLLNKAKFQSVKAKYVYFYLLPALLESPLGVEYDKRKVVPPTNIECELLFYSTHENAVIHLGIEKKTNDTYYIPRTFFIEKLSKENIQDIYIFNQEKIEVEKEQRIILQKA